MTIFMKYMSCICVYVLCMYKVFIVHIYMLCMYIYIYIYIYIYSLCRYIIDYVVYIVDTDVVLIYPSTYCMVFRPYS